MTGDKKIAYRFKNCSQDKIYSLFIVLLVSKRLKRNLHSVFVNVTQCHILLTYVTHAGPVEKKTPRPTTTATSKSHKQSSNITKAPSFF